MVKKRKEPDRHPIEAWLEESPRTRSKSGLAKKVGCHPSRITQILAGQRPSPDLAFKIEKLTRIDARQLLGIPQESAA